MNTETRPEINTLIWWRHKDPPSTKEWSIGRACETGVLGDGLVRWSDIEWIQARILAPNEVAVEIPRVEEWQSDQISLVWEYTESNERLETGIVIDLAEAENQE
jgi:hypothetical protein